MGFKNDELRMICKNLAVGCDALLRQMDRMGKQAELMEEYERTDTLLIKMRMVLLESIRGDGVAAVTRGEKVTDSEKVKDEYDEARGIK